MPSPSLQVATPREATAAPALVEELGVLLAGTAERRAARAERIGQLAARVDGNALLRWLARQRMLLLGAARLRSEAPTAWTPALEATVAGVAGPAHRRAAAFTLASDAILAALERSGVPALPLKGPSLARRVHGDPGLRDYADLDVLVASTDLPRAVSACEALGYLPPAPTRDLPPLHHALVHGADALPVLELHWRVHWYETTFAGDVLARARAGGADVERLPEPLDELACLLLFFARDGFVGVRLAADIAAWWDALGGSLAPGALGALGRRYPELAPAWEAAAHVAEREVGLPAAWLLGSSTVGCGPALAVRLANPGIVGDADQVAADVTLVDGLCSPHHGLRAWVRRHVVCDADRLRDYYDLASDARGTRLWFARVVHPPKTLARYALALGRVRAGRERRA